MDSYNIMFVIIAVLMLLSTFACVLTKSIIRSATYLFLTLLGTAGLYFLLGYTFLGSVQVMVYCGGVVVLYVFAIMLTKGQADKISDNTKKKMIASFLLTLVGLSTFAFALIKHQFLGHLSSPDEAAMPIHKVGEQMLSTGASGYLLPFEVVSVLLLSCIVAALLIARKR